VGVALDAVTEVLADYPHPSGRATRRR